MSQDKLARLLIRFATAAKAHHEALEAMDGERGNAHACMLAALHRALLREGEPGLAGLLELVDSDAMVVAGMAAVH